MDIQKLREEINSLDDALVELFCRRMETAKKIAEYKKENALPVFDRTREREVLHRLTGQAPKELVSYIKALYATLFELSKTHQLSVLNTPSLLTEKIHSALRETPSEFPSRATIACQGTEGAYSQAACDRMFSCPSIHYVDNFNAVFHAVDSGLCQYGILPVENSTAGSVTAVYELMQKYKFHIVKSTKLFINHSLLACRGAKLSDVKEIFSHEQALHQCSDYTAKLPGVKVTVCKNTAIAARDLAASGRTDAAVICSSDCADLYNLSVLATGISNTQNNYTRFICISKKLEIYPGANRTSLMVRLPHKPGSLNALLSRFNALDINLTKLESRPVIGTNFEFMFYFDIESSVYSPQFTELLAQLEYELPELTYLGSYYES